MHYPNGAKEEITPTVSAYGQATFSHPAGAPYLMSGDPSTAAGKWNNLYMTYGDGSVETYSPETNSDPDMYVLNQVTNTLGESIIINRDSNNNYRINAIGNNAGNALLQFNYSGANLASVQDVASGSSDTGDQRQVSYTFSGGNLSAVSLLTGINPTGAQPSA